MGLAPGASPAGTGGPRSGGGSVGIPSRRPRWASSRTTGSPEDGVCRDDATDDPSNTLVVACCDPAVGLLADALARRPGVRLIALPRSSRTALAMLEPGLVHAAGVHLATGRRGRGKRGGVRRWRLGTGSSLLRVARWEEGSPSPRARTWPRSATRSGPLLRWVGREPGSGARQCLDELLSDRRPPPEHLAADHRGVAEAVRLGWADAGVCLRLTSEEAGLDFLSVREEAYDLCYPDALADDPRPAPSATPSAPPPTADGSGRFPATTAPRLEISSRSIESPPTIISHLGVPLGFPLVGPAVPAGIGSAGTAGPTRGGTPEWEPLYFGLRTIQ